MTDPTSLKTIGIATGLFLLLLHMPALVKKNVVRGWLRKFPRSRLWGTILLTLATLWTLSMVMTMDLSEFARLRIPIMGFVVVAAILSWQFLNEFLAVRSLGVLSLLVAHPILNSCFLQTPLWRLLLVILAYTWILCGLLWVGMPYLLRDQIAWVSASSLRWNLAAGIGALFGFTLLGCAFF